MKIIRKQLMILGVILIYLEHGNGIEEKSYSNPCTELDHLTDPEFTCCGFIMYDPPEIYAKKNLAKCFQLLEKTDTKIVNSAWSAFQCLVDLAIPDKEVTLDEFTKIISAKLSDDIKGLVQEGLGHLENHTAYTGSEALGEFEELANIWNTYYTAENWACRKQNTKEAIKLDPELRCFSWIERTMRRGDCCNGIAIPFQLHSDPVVLKYFALRNYTANKLITLAGSDYNWQNSSIVTTSDTVSSCKKTAELILQNKLTLEEIEKQTQGQFAPNYDSIAEILIPKFLSPTTRKFFKDEMLKVDNETRTGLQFDYTIENMMNRNASLYQFVYASEWGKKGFEENSTRFLLWTCRAHVLLDQLYKNVDYTDMCY